MGADSAIFSENLVTAVFCGEAKIKQGGNEYDNFGNISLFASNGILFRHSVFRGVPCHKKE